MQGARRLRQGSVMAILNWLQITITAAITAVVALGLHEIDVSFIKAGQVNALQSLQSALVSQCNADKKITQEVSHDYEIQIASVNARLDSLRQHPTCVPIASTTTGNNAATNLTRPNKPNGIDSSALYDYAGDYAKERLKLIGCQKFITDTWKEKGAN